MRILFIGTGEIGLPTLEWLIQNAEHELVAVVTQPDKPVGRKLVLTAPQVKVRALAAGLPVLQPEKIRLALDELRAFQPDLAVVVAYGQLLPKALLELPRYGCWNVHASLLPKYRGASPIQAAIREGEAETGITLMQMDEGLDTGDMLVHTRLPLSPAETGGTLHDRLAKLAPAALAEGLAAFAAGRLTRQPQDHSQATHCGKLRRIDGQLNWMRPAVALERLIRAYQPWPGTHALLPGGAVLKVHAAEVLPLDEATLAVPGTVLSEQKGLAIACGHGTALQVLEVQAEGGRRLSAAAYLNGSVLSAGTVLA
jgi:methionyl-tRNA formyltransferase